MRGLILLLVTASIGGCAAPIGSNGLPVTPAQLRCSAAIAANPPVPPPLMQQPFCTRSLGEADCWTDPARLPNHPSPLGDTPAPTPGCG